LLRFVIGSNDDEKLGNEPFTSLFFQLWNFGFEKPWLDPPSKSILMTPQKQSSRVITPLDSEKKVGNLVV
jgi:hypothetical protein